MPLTLTASNGVSLTAEPNEWIVGLVLLLDDTQKARLIEIVAGLMRTTAPGPPPGVEKHNLPGGVTLTLINGAQRLS